MVKMIKFCSNYAFCWPLITNSIGFGYALNRCSIDFFWALKPKKNLCYKYLEPVTTTTTSPPSLPVPLPQIPQPPKQPPSVALIDNKPSTP